MTTDKSSLLTTTITLLNEKLHFEGKADGNEPVSIDYTPPYGDNLGYTSLELFLLSLSSCAGSAILVILRRMNKSIQRFSITATGFRKTEHPTGFREIHLLLQLQSKEVTLEELERVVERMEGICPVLSMLSRDVPVRYSFNLVP
jgi:uncharacterized OsmC-like protein